ncbi:MAG: type VI secretion system baseplate subunit TssK [Planctomycetia bacterium]|nr:MAG: type VI secretion system baseplate subunit TssK [Planctomycetia bacterium]
MSQWNAVHWHEGMFLRPQHMQLDRRWVDAQADLGVRAFRAFGWGILELGYAADALESFTLRLDECILRMKDGTWIRVPENAGVEPLNFQQPLEDAGGTLDILIGVPQYDPVRANAVSITTPQETTGNPRFEAVPVFARDENGGDNQQRILVRRLRARLFTGRDDLTGYDVLRIGAVRRSSRSGSPPEFIPELTGPHLAIQGNPELNRLFIGILGSVEGKGDELARQAREQRLSLSAAGGGHVDHLLKIHILNGVRTRLRALESAPLLHPYDLYVELSAAAGALSICDETQLSPESIPPYDHDYPGRALEAVRDRVRRLLEWLSPENCEAIPFVRVSDARGVEGLSVELKPSWIEQKLDMYIALESSEHERADDLLQFIYQSFDMKLGSPTRAAQLVLDATQGLVLRARAAPAGVPQRPGRHFFWIDKAAVTGMRNYWLECENDRAICLTMKRGQREAFENFRPTLYVLLRRG